MATYNLVDGDTGSTHVSANSEVTIEQKQIAELVQAQYSGLLSLMHRKLKDRELAAEILNEGIVVTLEHARLGRLTHKEQIGGYVFRVCMNLLRNIQRTVANRPDLRINIECLDILTRNDTDGIESEQIRRKAQQLIESLSSARDREVVKRFYLDEEDKESICEALSLTPLQFNLVLSRARQRMKLIFETQGHKRIDFLSLLL
jgi:RNA polymerase sigma-70 factor (ECF subfamily)